MNIPDHIKHQDTFISVQQYITKLQNTNKNICIQLKYGDIEDSTIKMTLKRLKSDNDDKIEVRQQKETKIGTETITPSKFYVFNDDIYKFIYEQMISKNFKDIYII